MPYKSPVGRRVSCLLISSRLRQRRHHPNIVSLLRRADRCSGVRSAITAYLEARGFSTTRPSTVHIVQQWVSPHPSPKTARSISPAAPMRDMGRPSLICTVIKRLVSTALHHSCTMVSMSQVNIFANPARSPYRCPEVEVSR